MYQKRKSSSEEYDQPNQKQSFMDLMNMMKTKPEFYRDKLMTTRFCHHRIENLKRL
jgi:hypothetical protein